MKNFVNTNANRSDRFGNTLAIPKDASVHFEQGKGGVVVVPFSGDKCGYVVWHYVGSIGNFEHRADFKRMSAIAGVKLKSGAIARKAA